MTLDEEMQNLLDHYNLVRALTVKERVENGARWLDENFSGWVDRIDVYTLNLDSTRTCICGQVFDPAVHPQNSGDDYDSRGYDFAEDTLFSEANHWITELVGIKPFSAAIAEMTMKGYVDRRKEARVALVSAALGFNELSQPYPVLVCGFLGGTHDQTKEWKKKFDEATFDGGETVTIYDLQLAWETFLAAPDEWADYQAGES